ncbi:hypothetical protein ACET3Z_000791 [Daucus carota]
MKSFSTRKQAPGVPLHPQSQTARLPGLVVTLQESYKEVRGLLKFSALSEVDGLLSSFPNCPPRYYCLSEFASCCSRDDYSRRKVR